MSNQSEIDYDKQFQDDLAKATALSLEQQALDDYRRAKKYGTAAHYYNERAQSQSPSLQHSHSLNQRQQSTESAVAFYAQLRTRYQQSRGNSSETTAPPPMPPHRRHSEANNNVSLNVAAVTAASRERSKTPPATLPESDLISFSSPTAKEAQPNTFEKLIEDLQKLQTSSQQTALVPFGPVAATPMTSMQAAAGFRAPPPPQATPTHNTAIYAAAAAAGAAGGGGGNCMQLVPFTPLPTAQQQKVPLTSEELQKLYNMPLQQQQQQQQYYQQHQQQHQHMAAIMPPGVVYPAQRMGFVPSVGGGFVAPTHASNYTQSAPPTAAAAATYIPPQFPSTVSHYGFQYGGMPPSAAPYYGVASAAAASPHISSTGSNVSIAAAPIPLTKSQSAAAAITPNDSNNKGGGGGGSSGFIGAVAAGARRPTPPVRKPQRTGNDLIDLSQEDDSRVSVLEAFDPLLNADEAGCDDGSDCTSYYAEYDPFDYLYSGGGTQYSDPVYEAVNKLEKSAVSPNVSSIGWRTDYLSRDEALATDPIAIGNSTHYQLDDQLPSGSRSPPPPLPPRNSGSRSPPFLSGLYPTLKQDNNFESSSQVGAGAGAGGFYSTPSSAVRPSATLDRRKTFGTRLYEVVTEQRTVDPELLEFFFMVKELRMRYLYNDAQTNPGHVIASEFNYHYPLETSIKILVHPTLKALMPHTEMARTQGQVKGYGVPVVFTCDINTAVELVIDQAFCSLEGQIKGTPNDYVVKPIGVSEWLSPTSKLSQLECVHNSLKLEQDVQLGLCVKSEESMQVIARTQSDDMRDAELRAEDVLPNEMATTINYDNMMILIETLETEIDKLESADPNSRSILSCSGVVQAAKAICALLGSIDTLEISACITDLKRICEESQVKYAAHTTESNPEIVSERGDYAEVRMVPRSKLDQIKLKCSQLRDAVQELIELYSNVFRVGFSVKSVDYSTTPIPVSCVLKPIVVSINCLHRPPPTWRYDDYSLGVQINYGTRFVSDPIVTKCSNDMSGGLFPRLNFSSWLTFEKNPICTLPRESRLIFVLYGTQTAENEQNTDANGERRHVATELGWCAIQLFDQKREMICGSYLLSMWPPTTDKFLGPAPARGCHPQPDICPVLSIEVPPYGGRILFPEPLEQPPPAPRYDFNSLDTNLQQELLDTAEQGYSGAKDKREVFWEKRLYLQSFPYALPKVLHAAHSWDYASLMDLHSLLHSWAPLSPLQALELLLPRYPDAKVREKAAEWISQLPNDQLVDYLPQLLQALKHDTYEASAMARFLLCKCLESPRIAHHMYWLLVHSLPGDDPQNSIDASSVANEIDESLITQARYYRRNKMMLRALLAICGERLLARFLSQNMMCKSLARLAESVKEAKESLRQKTLCFGMDTVHQQLGDKPTSLPLGPELEVTGVNVRSCSYFNSNTLPLKISYIGSDGEVLPAIFKSGDDLQQDMLTIQLIRVMNKMWLAEGLDLKMVTFNCVPTGFKKGMIELVSDAETLRKIQVEYGLTGSFKDRPIAEWLAKQNPSQLEYQRAVKNFTVSCAGYSVATYILGICDRHNDNIMLKTSGHLFHIDFGKFLGDAQMFGNFKRDRTPFVLTSDMAYVINGGDKPSTDFHYFVDLCCRAFNIIRKHGDLILHMLALMATAGIPGVTADAVTYVRGALLPEQSNPEAAASFAKMIQFSLKSWFTQFNFFLHNLAQMRFSNDEGSGELLSFVPRKYTMQQDGRLKSVMVVRCQKHYDMEKYYTYILQVTRHGQTDPTHLFRSYKEFTEFHQKLCLHFPLAKLHSLPSGMHVGRSNVKSVAERRLPQIQRFLISLFNSADEIAHSDLVYTFFHPLLRDQQEAKLTVSKVREVKQPTRENPYEVGQIKISLQYRRGVLTVMIHHAKGLPMLQGGQEPNTYVKCYLKPDATKVTKRKTKVVRKTCVPSFMETLEYRMPMEHIQIRTLHVTVWSHDTLQENELLGGFQIDLSKYDLRKELIDWFRLGPMPRN
ncbi:phosphatidylinositol 4-phosphate 3-kinase C2 domain-containing subunit beta [Anastrepha obliqua]|uniref:phosphatidylinositol 4-phosphate 3-kinase C2 domain-containing subunit beta n=1 Tax=Anastrepha obliqua TaxID=95512 RepID=UPI0024099C6F|nr:phosphatidylinositol 4-phosphate 3-kinase C2 domain-containing subunit beta [Anastrepha obliqua]XP_054734880.1 phosphatidylinositol 4-phosphate 3-kinase C2 domain-containing subunit beta [Anastrepha obliqua]XP_054734881.1 phosphatidylinositol 4-phosphate 3-kinase C2 domain-containing subunit beta [Anastrepha obliqua]XP_054734882.1 phosphatidylinositol 4-phosphate 3-kinase C2 domain-containing subunit beta [Anastrepha obliqua]